MEDKDLERYDLVVAADVIEHMPKDEAVAWMRRIPGRILINTPIDFFHNGDGLPPTEEHVSHWTRQDFIDIGRLAHHEEFLGGHIALFGPRP
jgi:hypothetical protein